MGDRLLLKLNIYGKPIANKYCEGKMKRTLKRGLKDLKSLRRKGLKGYHLVSILLDGQVSLDRCGTLSDPLSREIILPYKYVRVPKGKMRSECRIKSRPRLEVATDK